MFSWLCSFSFSQKRKNRVELGEDLIVVFDFHGINTLLQLTANYQSEVPERRVGKAFCTVDSPKPVRAGPAPYCPTPEPVTAWIDQPC